MTTEPSDSDEPDGVASYSMSNTKQELVEAGVLADAVTVCRAPWKNFVRRLARDLREHRKPPLTLLRRGRSLMRTEQALVVRQERLGCRACNAHETADMLAALRKP